MFGTVIGAKMIKVKEKIKIAHSTKLQVQINKRKGVQNALPKTCPITMPFFNHFKLLETIATQPHMCETYQAFP